MRYSLSLPPSSFCLFCFNFIANLSCNSTLAICPISLFEPWPEKILFQHLSAFFFIFWFSCYLLIIYFLQKINLLLSFSPTVLLGIDESPTSRVQAKGFFFQDTIPFAGEGTTYLIICSFFSFLFILLVINFTIFTFQVSDLRNSLNTINSASEEASDILLNFLNLGASFGLFLILNPFSMCQSDQRIGKVEKGNANYPFVG